MARCLPIGALAVDQQVERLAQRVLDITRRRFRDFDLPLSLRGLGRQPLLLGVQEVEGDGVGVVGMEQLLAFLAEIREAVVLASYLGFCLLAHSRQRLAELRPDPLDLAVGQSDLAVDALDGGLDQIDRDVGLLAAGALHPADAEEVGVLATVALGLDQAHPRAATPAVEGALQVVVVLSVLLGRVVVGGEDGFCLGEGGAVDQVLMAALVLDPGVADDADVVGVLEHRGKLRARERLRRLLRGRPGAKTALAQSREQSVERVGAGAVGGERPAHVRRPLGVHLDGAEFAALDHLAHVQIADRRPRRRASSLRLLHEPLLRLGGEVGRVELGVGGDDRVHEAPDRRAVDVLSHRDQLDPGFMQRIGDRRVVVAVAGEPIDLVDDHVVEVAVRFESGQKRLQFRPVGGLRRLAAIDVLGDHFG